MDNVALALLFAAVLGAGASLGGLVVLTLRATLVLCRRLRMRRLVRKRLQLLQDGRL